MSEPFIGEIKMFAGNFSPRSFAFCDGQLLAVSQNNALFSLFGTIYGGDGRTTFGLPELRGRVPIHQGSGPGLTPRSLGSKSGVERATVSSSQFPTHTHPLMASTSAGQESSPAGSVLAQTSVDVYDPGAPGVAMNAGAISSTAGGGQSHTNLMPFQCVNFIVALTGIFPSRN